MQVLKKNYLAVGFIIIDSFSIQEERSSLRDKPTRLWENSIAMSFTELRFWYVD